MEIFIIILLMAVLIFLIWDKFFHKPIDQNLVLRDKEQIQQELFSLKAEYQQKNTELGQINQELSQKSQKIAVFEEREQQNLQIRSRLEEENKVLKQQKEEFQKKIQGFEFQINQKEQQLLQKISEIEQSRQALEDEKKRIRREDEEEKARIESERDRIWNEHEQNVQTRLREVCIKPEIGFNFYDNTNLPPEMDGSFKPDFLVEFMGQYLIFDAKVSKDVNNYLLNQSKSTAKKIIQTNNRDSFYNTVFFIVPSSELSKLNKSYYYENQYSFFVISPEAIEPILFAYRKMLDYENLDSLDPQERENLINLIANLDHHLNWQNAIHILEVLQTRKILKQQEQLPADWQQDIQNRKQNIRLESLGTKDLKRFLQNPTEQLATVQQLINPSAALIAAQDLDEAQKSLF